MAHTETQSQAASPSSSGAGAFVQLFARHSRRIYSYILTLVPNPTDADEIYQDTSMILWEKFGEFEPGTHFGAWACKIAHFRVLSYYKKNRNNRHVSLDEETAGVLGQQLQQLQEAESDLLEARHEALMRCLGRLPARQQEILRHRYAGGSSVSDVAEAFQTSANAVSKALGRIHRSLLDCITRRLKTQKLA